ncbi:MAG: DMT family transporter [Clostridia bacterium]|nr:DMT family transporter [Clostridia bacterium]
MKRFSLKGPVFLLLAAFFWGTTFVAQDLASDAVGPFTFNGLRMVLGSLFLLPVILIRNKGRLFASVPTKEAKKELLSASLLCGAVMFVAANLQQFGIFLGTGAGKSGFITAMYVVMVPVAGLFFGKKVRPLIWACIAAATVGLYFLCMASFDQGLVGLVGNLSMSVGDLLTLGCAVFYTVHILCIDMKASHLDGVFLSCLQFLFAGIAGLVAAFLFEKPTLDGVMAGSGGILYSAFFSCAIAYTLQILGQQCTPAAVASILMCMESVFAVLSDLIVLKTALTVEEVLGCVLMFFAIVFSNLAPFLPNGKSNKKAR